MSVNIGRGDALVVVDVQADFVSGSLAVPGAASIVPAVQELVKRFESRGLPVVATRDWHPAAHASFRSRGGPWPAHCVQGGEGARFAGGLRLGPDVHVVSKGADPERDAYSGFDGTSLDALLRARHVRRLFVCGLATDYCVRATALDALRLGYAVFVLEDAIAAVNLREGDGRDALDEMRNAGAACLARTDVDFAEPVHG